MKVCNKMKHVWATNWHEGAVRYAVLVAGACPDIMPPWCDSWTFCLWQLAARSSPAPAWEAAYNWKPLKVVARSLLLARSALVM